MYGLSDLKLTESRCYIQVQRDFRSHLGPECRVLLCQRQKDLPWSCRTYQEGRVSALLLLLEWGISVSR